MAIFNEKPNKCSLDYLKSSFGLQAECCYRSRRSLQQVLLHVALKARQHHGSGHWAWAPAPCARYCGAAPSWLQASPCCPRLPATGQVPSGQPWPQRHQTRRASRAIKSHRDLLCEQGLSVAAVHPRQPEKASPLATTAGLEEEVCPSPRPLGGLPRAPLTSLIGQTGKCSNSGPPSRELVVKRFPLVPGRLGAAGSPPDGQMHAQRAQGWATKPGPRYWR